jgi:quercetin dioxygenase-like cupin family protein
MKTANINDMVRGWFIGNFEPSVLRTKDFEVGILSHKKGEIWPEHYHKIATEYNVLISGKMLIKNTIIDPGTIFIFEPGETADPQFLEDCNVLVVKTPSVIGDKYNV